MEDMEMGKGNEAASSLLRQKIIVFLGVVGVSFSGIFAKVFTAPSIYIVLWRMIFTVLILFIPFLKELKKEKANLDIRTLLCCAVSGTFLAVHFASFFESVRLASVASGTLLINTSVFFVPMITVPFMGEKLSAKAMLGIIMTFAGSAVVAMADSGAGSNVLLGDALAVFGAFCMAVYTIMGKICRRKLSTTVYTTLVYIITGITAFILVLAQGIPLTGYGMIDYGSAIGMAVFCTLLGHSVFSWGLKYVSAAFVSTVKLAEPVCAALLALMLFGERPSLMTIMGGAVIIAGVAWTVKFSD